MRAAAAEANVASLILAATERHRSRADALLAAHTPEIERDPWARLVLGRDWEDEPNELGGPRDWALLYVCYSSFASPALARAASCSIWSGACRS